MCVCGGGRLITNTQFSLAKPVLARIRRSVRVFPAVLVVLYGIVAMGYATAYGFGSYCGGAPGLGGVGQGAL